MVAIFTTTTSLLASEFVESFPAEKLAVTLFKIGQDTGVEFNRQKKTFSIAGHWNSILKAHQTLELFFDNESFQSNDDVYDNGENESLSENGENSKSKERKSHPLVSDEGRPGRKPGTSIKISSDKTNVPDPVVLYQYKEKSFMSQELLKPTNLLNALERNPKNPLTTNCPERTLKESDQIDEQKRLPTVEDDTNKERTVDIDEKSASNTENFDDSSTDIDESYLANETQEQEQLNTETADAAKTSDDLKIKIKVETIELDSVKHQSKKSRRKSKPVKIVQTYTTVQSEQELPSKPKKQKRGQKKASPKDKTEPGISEGTNKSEVILEYRCNLCSYSGTKKSNLKEHVKRKHRNKFTCDVCQKQFGFNKDLTRHKRQVHSEPAHFCDVCRKFYKSKRVYDEHILTHRENYIKPNYDCKICPKSFSTKYVLAAHIKAEHLGMKKSYMCPTCGRSFTQKNSYVMHANVHAGIKPYVCDICGKAFTYDKSLKEHKFMHDNIRRFQCHICSKTFRQTTSLRIHMKVHKESKDYMCTSCGKGFTQKQALLRHERIHSGDKPYVCALCNRSFSDYSIIRRHMMLIHKKDPKDWRGDIISNLKRKKDYYIEGGPGHHIRELRSVEDVNKSSEIGKGTDISSQVSNIVKQLDPDTVSHINHDTQVFKQNMIRCHLHSAEQNSNEASQHSIQDLSQNHVTLLPPLYSAAAAHGNQAVHRLTDSESGVPPQTSSPVSQLSSALPINYSLTEAYTSNTSDNPSHSDITGETTAAQYSVLEEYRNHPREVYTTSSNTAVVSTTNSYPEHLRGQLAVPSIPGLLGETIHPQLIQAWAYPGYGPYYSPSNITQYQNPQN